jgi:hypothetical protein
MKVARELVEFLVAEYHIPMQHLITHYEISSFRGKTDPTP